MSSESHTGFFISFEGSEGCGKSTQIGLLMNALQEAGQPPLLVREPGGTPLGEQIRHLLKHAPEGKDMTPEAELLLFAASRAQLAREVIQPALAEGRIVISDRFLDSTTVYQGVARRIPGESVDLINQFAAGSRLPDVTFLLDMDPVAAMERARRRNEVIDRLEQEPLEFFHAVRNGYLALAERHPDRICVIDASQAPSSVSTSIRQELQRRCHGLFSSSSI
ncbi:MAG: dTMP kinase [Verrucomicrobia bacterium 61-8]|nr:dTMP kinase [Verrucomicrobiota bacterium]OJV04651.1 MAG: dTMP kinase [Verrucomicrobia bacterium 61-8]